MKSAVDPQSSLKPTESRRRRRVFFLLAGAIIFFCGLWLVQAPLLNALLRGVLPAAARAAGYELTFEILQARLLAPVVLGNVHARTAAGTDLQAARVEVAFATAAELLRRPRHILRRVTVRDLTGTLHPPAGGLSAPWPALSDGAGVSRFLRVPWPSIIQIYAPKLLLSHGARHVLFKQAELSLHEGGNGRLQIGGTEIRFGTWSKSFGSLHGVTAWHEGIANFSDLALAEDVVVDSLAVTLGGTPAFTLRVRMFGGDFYADWSGWRRATAAVNARKISLGALGTFLAMEPRLQGRLDVLKLTYRGDPHEPLGSQSSLRVEAADVSFGPRALTTLRLGASLSERRLKIEECALEQKGNSLVASGAVLIPTESADWRGSGVDIALDATLRDVRALSGLFGPRWAKLSGGMVLGAKVGGRLGEPEGWIRIRGWDLRAPGIPASSFQADATMQGGVVKVAGLESHSGPDFLRAVGEASLRKPLSYQGHLEARLRDISRYLEPLGRFAPDWAREGGAIIFWDGDGAGDSHSGVVSLELFNFTGELNPVPVNGKVAATYSPGNIYVSRFLLDRGPLSLSASGYLSEKGLSVQDIQMFNQRQRLLRGEVFLPVSFPLLLEGKTWSQAMRSGGEVYAAIRSDDMRLGGLANLFGQSTPVEGNVDWKLDASGRWEDPAVESSLSIEGFRASGSGFAIPSSQISGRAKLEGQRLDINGSWKMARNKAATLTASIPLLSHSASDGWRILNRKGSATGQLVFPAMDLSAFAAGQPLAGILSGTLTLAGTLDAPQLLGELAWDKATFVPVEGLQPVTGCSGRVVFEGTAARVEGGKGTMGEGTFAFGGQCVFANPADVSASFDLTGNNLLFVKSPTARFVGDAKLLGLRAGGEEKITGEIGLTESRASLTLTGSPVLLSAGTSVRNTVLPIPFAVRGLLAGWTSDIRVLSTKPVELGNGAQAHVDLRLTGAAGHFLSVGLVDCSGLQATLPSGSLIFSRARFHFTPEVPGTPILDLQGATQAHGYEIRATLWGPLGEQQIRLSSTPELSPAQIVLLLGAGLPPEGGTRAGQLADPAAPPLPPELPSELLTSRLGYLWDVRRTPLVPSK